jgi:hypothetical protein
LAALAELDATFFGSPDGSGSALGTQAAATADTSLLQIPAGTNSIRFEGYFEVPSPGPYSFFAGLDKAGAQAEFRLPDLLPAPIIPAVAGAGAAGNDAAELTSVAVDLKAGMPYRFSLLVSNLGTGNARLLVVGETLPKDSISQLTLYAKSSVERIDAASVLLAKTLQYAQTLSLDERELRYLVANAADFDDLSFSRLPTRASDPAAAAPTALCQSFLRLAAYAQLKNELAGGGDDLIDVFAGSRLTYPASTNVAQSTKGMLDDLCQRVANLARRDPGIVQAAATRLGMTPHATALSVGW